MLGHPLIKAIVIFVTMLFAILLVFMVRELDLSPLTIGVIFSVSNVGALIGALTATRLARRLGIGPAHVVVASAGGLGLLLVPLASGGLAIPFLAVANFLWGFFVLNYYVTAISLIQAITPDRLLGRTNASRRFLVQGVIPVGALLGGGLGTWLGLRTTVAIGAVGACAAVLPLLLSRLARIGSVEEAQEFVRPYNETFLAAAPVAE